MATNQHENDCAKFATFLKGNVGDTMSLNMKLKSYDSKANKKIIKNIKNFYVVSGSMNVANVAITGALEKNIKIVDATYALKKSYFDNYYEMEVVLELSKKYTAKLYPKINEISLIPLNKDGSEFCRSGASFEPKSNDDYENIAKLIRGKVGDKLVVTFLLRSNSDNVVKEMNTFSVNTGDVKDNWEKIIRAAEDCVKKGSNLVVRCKQGDYSACYSLRDGDFAPNADYISNKLNEVENNKKVQSELSERELKAYKKIVAKLIDWENEMSSYSPNMQRFTKIDVFAEVDAEMSKASETKSSSTSKASSSGSEDWDEILDDYEKFVNDYVKVLKKVNNGDITAMSDMTEMLEKAEELGNKLENASDELSEKQQKRYTEILQKMLR